MNRSTVKAALLLGAAVAVYEAVLVSLTGYDVFYRQPVQGAYRQAAALRWGTGAAVLGLLAWRQER